MLKKQWVLALVVGLGWMSSNAGAQSLSECDALYAARGVGAALQKSNSLFAAVDCYEKQLAGKPSAEQREIFERIFIALSAVVNTQPKTNNERRAIDRAFEVLEKLKAGLAGTADEYYWNAVWLAFDSKALDRGSVLPRNIFRNLRTIQAQLRQAMELNPVIHTYGPHRVLGMMHSEMPGIVGGDKALAEKLLVEAWSKAPRMSVNWTAYATILDINGKSSEAVTVLKKFLSMPDSEFNPYPDAARALTFETQVDRKKAKELLESIEGEEN